MPEVGISRSRLKILDVESNRKSSHSISRQPIPLDKSLSGPLPSRDDHHIEQASIEKLRGHIAIQRGRDVSDPDNFWTRTDQSTSYGANPAVAGTVDLEDCRLITTHQAAELCNRLRIPGTAHRHERDGKLLLVRHLGDRAPRFQYQAHIITTFRQAFSVQQDCQFLPPDRC